MRLSIEGESRIEKIGCILPLHVEHTTHAITTLANILTDTYGRTEENLLLYQPLDTYSFKTPGATFFRALLPETELLGTDLRAVLSKAFPKNPNTKFGGQVQGRGGILDDWILLKKGGGRLAERHEDRLGDFWREFRWVHMEPFYAALETYSLNDLKTIIEDDISEGKENYNGDEQPGQVIYQKYFDYTNGDPTISMIANDNAGNFLIQHTLFDKTMIYGHAVLKRNGEFIEAEVEVIAPEVQIEKALVPALIWSKEDASKKRTYYNGIIPSPLFESVDERANTLAGLLIATAYSQKQKDQLPFKHSLEKGRYFEQSMTEAQIPVLASYFRDVILESEIFEKLEQTV